MADLTITKSDNPDPVPANAPLTYTIVVSNVGSAETSGSVAVTDTPPANFTITSFSTTSGGCAIVGPQSGWDPRL